MRYPVFYICMLFCTIPILLMGQKGKLIYYTQPDKALLKIDTLRLSESGKVYELDTGKYAVQIWAPTTKLISDFIEIKPNQLTIYRKKMTVTDEYISFKNELAKYKKPGKTLLLYTAIAGGLYLANTFPLNSNYKKAKKEKQLFEEAVSLEEIQNHRENYDNFKKRYKLHHDINNALVITSAVLIPAQLIRIALHKRKNIKPEYREVPLLSCAQLYTDYKKFVGLSITHNF